MLERCPSVLTLLHPTQLSFQVFPTMTWLVLCLFLAVSMPASLSADGGGDDDLHQSDLARLLVSKQVKEDLYSKVLFSDLA